MGGFTSVATSGTTDDLLSAPIRQTRPFSRRQFLNGAGALAGGLLVDASLLARHNLQIVHRTLRIRQLPDAFHGFRIVQLSDIHLDEFTEPAFIRLAIHRINRLAPDLVLLTGDFASRGPLALRVSLHAIEHCADLLRHLACPLRFGCLGNHDNSIGPDFVMQTLAGAGVTVLRNRHIPVERGGQRLWLGAVDDASSGEPILDLAVPRDPDGPVVLLSHSPDFADFIMQHPRGPLVDLVLSGHTHGGQIRLPLLGPALLPPMGKRYVEGLFRFNQMQLYVNRGIGTVGLPLRWNCPPEITHFTLQPA